MFPPSQKHRAPQIAVWLAIQAAFGTWSEPGPLDFSCPALPASATFYRVDDRSVDPAAATGRPGAPLAECPPGKFGCTEGRNFRNFTYLDFAAEEIGLCLDHERGGGGSTIGTEELQRT